MGKIKFEDFKEKVEQAENYILEQKSIGFITISEIVGNIIGGCIYNEDGVPIVNHLQKEAWTVINIFSLVYDIDLECIYTNETQNEINANKFIEVFNFLNKHFRTQIQFSISNWEQFKNILDSQVEMEIKKKTSIEYNLMKKIDEITEIAKNTDIKGLLQLINELPPEVVGNVVSLFSGKKKTVKKKRVPKQIPERE